MRDITLDQTSIRLEFELFTNECDGVRERTCTDAKRSFANACLAMGVLRDVEDRRLALAQCAHHLKPPDGRVGGLQRFETPHRTYQLLQFAMVGFDDVVQILDLSMHRFFRTFALGLQFRDRDAVGWGFVRVDDIWLLPNL